MMNPVANNFGPINTIVFETDELHLQVTEHHGTPISTVYGMLRDLINIARADAIDVSFRACDCFMPGKFDKPE